MRKLLLTSAFLAMTSMLSAAIVNINISLTTGQEIPLPAISPGSNPVGTAALTIDTTAETIDAILTWTDMTTPVTMAHLHRRNPGALVGPPVHTFFMGVSLPQTDTFDNEGPDPLDNPTAVIEGLRDGTLYVNVHTVQNPPGEIRGDIAAIPDTAIPEPSSMILLAAGLGLFALKPRRT